MSLIVGRSTPRTWATQLSMRHSLNAAVMKESCRKRRCSETIAGGSDQSSLSGNQRTARFNVHRDESLGERNIAAARPVQVHQRARHIVVLDSSKHREDVGLND